MDTLDVNRQCCPFKDTPHPSSNIRTALTWATQGKECEIDKRTVEVHSGERKRESRAGVAQLERGTLLPVTVVSGVLFFARPHASFRARRV